MGAQSVQARAESGVGGAGSVRASIFVGRSLLFAKDHTNGSFESGSVKTLG